MKTTRDYYKNLDKLDKSVNKDRNANINWILENIVRYSCTVGECIPQYTRMQLEYRNNATLERIITDYMEKEL